MRCGERTQQRLVPSPPFGRLGSLLGLDRLFEIVWQELPKWDGKHEAHVNEAHD